MFSQAPITGRRIVVWGVTGSGKTTFASQLAKILDVPAIHLDALFWNPDWVETPDDEFRAKVQAAIGQALDGWVLDGSYSRISSTYLSTTDTVIWLHLPWRVSFWRLLQRTLIRAWTRESLYYEGGPRESWGLSFLDRRSILWWAIAHHRTATRGRRDRVAQLPPSVRVYELRSSKEVRSFLDVFVNRKGTRRDD